MPIAQFCCIVEINIISVVSPVFMASFDARQLYRQVLLSAYPVLAMAILSCLSVHPSQPGTESSPGEIETPGFHRMIA